MRLLNLSWPMWVVGLVGLAAILFLLQRLRVRYRQRTVITTLFWKEALEEARARVLVRRFRHPLAYLLVLLICALMWLGFADPHTNSEGGREHIILLDGSASMSQQDRFASTVALLENHLLTLPDDGRRVILCGSSSRTLLAPGETSVLLGARLDDISPEQCPATVESTLRDLLRSAELDGETIITIAGAASISPTTMAELPASVRIQRLMTPVNPFAGTAITALGVGRAASGSWDRVDVLCEVRGATDALQLHTTIGGKPTSIAGRHEQPGPGWTRIVFADVPADGQVLRVDLPGDSASAANNSAAIRLPARARIRVQILDADLQSSIGAALTADAAVEITADNPDVVVASTSQVAASQASLRFVATGSQADAVVLHRRSDSTDSERDILAIFSQLGISEVDAMDAAQATGRPIAIGTDVISGARSVTMWRELLNSQFNFVQSRSFPLFVARSIRWLAGITEDPAYLAAGEPSPQVSTPRKDSSGRLLDPVGSAFVPPEAGPYTHADGSAVIASMFPDLTPRDAATIPDVTSRDGGMDITWGLALAGLLLLLLLGEWFLVTTGRIP